MSVNIMDSSKKVFIWGSYRHANYGDDIMAILLGRSLIRLGYTPVLFELSESIAADNGFEVTDSISSGVQSCEFCVIGGGAVFSVYHNPNTDELSYFQEMADLAECCQTFDKSIFGFSIGSGSCTSIDELHELQKTLLLSAKLKQATVRLKSDMPLFELAGIDSIFVPDVVLSAVSSLDDGVDPADRCARTRLIVNLSAPPALGSIVAYFLKCLCVLTGVRLEFVSVYSRERAVGELRSPEIGGASLRMFTDPSLLLEFLADSKGLLLTNKLHLAMSTLPRRALQFSIFRAKSKTRAFYEENGLSACIQTAPGVLLDLLKFCFLRRYRKTVMDESYISSSKRHYEQLERFIQIMNSTSGS